MNITNKQSNGGTNGTADSLADEIIRSGKPAPRIYHMWGNEDVADKGGSADPGLFPQPGRQSLRIYLAALSRPA